MDGDGPNIEVVDVGELALLVRVDMEGNVKIAGRLPKDEIVSLLHRLALEFELRP